MILIADSGSTKTAWRLIDEQGKITQYNSIGIHPLFMTTAEIETTLRKQLLPAIGFPKPEMVHEIYFYGAGCGTTERCKLVENGISAVFTGSTIQVESDLLGAARGLCGHEPGIAMILGTGSNSCVYNGKHLLSSRPSLGFILGDEGSGAHIGKTLIKDFLYEQMPSNLYEALKLKLQKDPIPVLEHIYQQPFPNRYLASFSKFVFQHIDHPYMSRLVLDSFLSFFDKHILHYETGQYPIHATGSVAYFFGPVLKEVASRHQLSIQTITESPIAGLTLYHLNEI